MTPAADWVHICGDLHSIFKTIGLSDFLVRTPACIRTVCDGVFCSVHYVKSGVGDSFFDCFFFNDCDVTLSVWSIAVDIGRPDGRPKSAGCSSLFPFVR